MQIVYIGDSLHECQILFSGKNKKIISKWHLLKILPKMLSIYSQITVSHITKSSTVFTLSILTPTIRRLVKEEYLVIILGKIRKRFYELSCFLEKMIKISSMCYPLN